MAARHLEALQLDADQVETAVDFFESYASFIQSSTSGVTSENALADAASSLRIAGQWAMLLDAPRAIDLLTASALIWHQMGDDLAGMAASYAESVDSAMANQRLWFNAAAPVDVGDTDTAAIAMIAARRLGSVLAVTHLRSATDGLGAIARVPIELAIEMIEGPEAGPAHTSTLS